MNARPPVKRSSTIFPYRGKWRIQYFDAEGKIRTKTVATQQDAYRDLVVLEQLVAVGKLPKRPKEIPQFSNWVGDWFESRKTEVRPSTLWGFESTIRLHLLPELGHLRLDQITSLKLEHLYQNLLNTKGLSAATVHKINALLSHALGRALRYGFIASNPCREVKLPRLTPSKLEVFDLIEIIRILETAKSLGPNQELRWLLALRYGMRQGECLALTWGDFNLEKRTVSVNKTVNSIPGRGFVLTAPKSDTSHRTIPLDEYTSEIVASCCNSRGAHAQNDLVFTSDRNTYIDARTDYDRWQRLLLKANVRQMKLHSARHAAATLLMNSGASIRSIQLLLGHSSPSFTIATYLHPSQEILRAEIEAVSKLSQRTRQGFA